MEYGGKSQRSRAVLAIGARPHTRMMGRWKVLAPHAELYPNDGAAEPVNPAHGARGWPVRG